MAVPVGLGIRVPDVAETLDRAETWKANRLAQLVQQRAMQDRERFGGLVQQHGGALFGGDPTARRTALEALVRGGGVEALPLATNFLHLDMQRETPLSPQEVAALGLPRGSVVFRTGAGGYRVAHTSPTYAPDREMVAVLDDNGNAVFVPRAQAAGRRPAPGFAGSSSVPASVQEWLYFQRLTPDQQRAYLLMKRAHPYINLGDVMAQPDPLAPGQVQGQLPVGLPPQRLVEGGTETLLPAAPGQPSRTPAGEGMERPEPRARDLPLTAEERAKAAQAATTATQTLRVIDGIVNHPALSAATGPLAWTQAIPGSPMYDFGTRVAQLQGRAFLQAFETLKGGGQITEVEGRKATDAIARLQSGMSPADVRAALGELREVVLTAQRRAALRARGQREAPPEPEPDVPSETPRVRRYNPQTGQLE